MLVGCSCLADAQSSGARSSIRLQLSGYIRNAESREVIRYALIAADSARSQSNTDGFYFVSLLPGSHRLIVRAIGFAPLDTW